MDEFEIEHEHATAELAGKAFAIGAAESLSHTAAKFLATAADDDVTTPFWKRAIAERCLFVQRLISAWDVAFAAEPRAPYKGNTIELLPSLTQRRLWRYFTNNKETYKAFSDRTKQIKGEPVSGTLSGPDSSELAVPTIAPSHSRRQSATLASKLQLKLSGLSPRVTPRSVSDGAPSIMRI